MKKVVIIGAGLGGISAAKSLGENGFDVTVYEKRSRNLLTYDWHDDIDPSLFDRVKIPQIDSKYYFKKGSWTFLAPGTSERITLDTPTEQAELSIERKPLSEYLISLAEPFSRFQFQTAVDGLLIEQETVRGVIVGGKKIYADLVIDSSGAESPFRETLPERYGITRTIGKEEKFIAYRGFYRRTEGQDADHQSKVYLKHLGEKGISWVITHPTYVDVLIGRVAELSERNKALAFDDLRKNNPILTDEVLRGGIYCTIPVRYPLSVLVGDGYLAIGDAAFMTIPMLGSGIFSSVVAGYELANILKEHPDTIQKAATLWDWQVWFYREFGGKHIGIDIIKRWLLDIEPDAIKNLFEKHIIGSSDMETASRGESIRLTLPFLLDKLRKGYQHIPTLLALSAALGRSKKAAAFADKIPKVYEERDVKKWATKLLTFFEH